MRPKLYIFDLDGTLYRGKEAMPHAADVVARLRQEGALVRFLTNNSSKHREQLLLKLFEVGIRAEMGEVWSSAIGAAKLLPQLGYRSAFVVGETGLTVTLADAGIDVQSSQPETVVAGMCRQFTYAWMNSALQHILRGAKFIATNRDATYPLEKGRVEPGAGAIVASIAAASQVEPVVVGKPEPYLISLLLEETGIPPEATMVVGDRYETDIESGKRAGCQTYLVLTGVTAEERPGQRGGVNLLGLLDR